MNSKKNIRMLFILIILNGNYALAHGQQMLYPLSADIILILIAFALLFKYRATWKFRLITFIGALFVIWFSWFLVNLILPEDNFGKYFYEHTVIFTITHWFINAILFAPIYLIAKKRFIIKSELPSEKGSGAA